MVVVPWSAPFPAPHVIPWFAFSGSSSATDELGNTIATWDDPVSVNVQGWDIMSSETLGEHISEEKFDASLQTQADFWPGIQDRIGLPLPGNGMVAPTSMVTPGGDISVGIFEVVGHDISDVMLVEWHPGNISLLKLVQG